MFSLGVIFTVYQKTALSKFVKAIESVVNQTKLPQSIIIVCDGCNSDLFKKAISGVVPHSIKLFFYSYSVNSGPGFARDFGIRKAEEDLIAVMDSDDVSVADRFALQLAFFESNENISVCGGFIEEFDNLSGQRKLRRVPLQHSDIQNAIKIKSPVNNVTAMFKRSDYLSSGGYPALRSSEDYSLWARFISSGYKIHNLDSVLVQVEFDIDAIQRRNGLLHFKNDFITQREMLKNGLIDKFEFVRNITKYCIFRFLPVGVKKMLYQHVLRK
ncbi:glycosyltransferase [Escherichia coli]|nr:glycosyltransferase [Escherichia coli]